MTRTARRAIAAVAIVAGLLAGSPANAASVRVGPAGTEDIVPAHPRTVGQCKVAEVSFWLVSVCV